MKTFIVICVLTMLCILVVLIRSAFEYLKYKRSRYFDINCDELIKKGKCKADCCDITVFNKSFWKKNKHRAVRKIKDKIEYSNNVRVITLDKKCVFLRSDYKCNVYDKRPYACSSFGLECPHKK